MQSHSVKAILTSHYSGVNDFPNESSKNLDFMVDQGGIEPPTSSLSEKRSNQLSY